MKRSSKILLKLTTKKFLYYLASLPAAAFVIFDRKRNYEKSLKEFDDWREANQQSFKNLLYRLSKARLIEKYQKQNQHLIRLTSKGKKKIIHYLTRELKIKQTSKWDKKWRIVIFDIPEKKENS